MLDFLNEPKTENKSTIHRVLGEKWETLITQPVLKNNLMAKQMSLYKTLSTVARIFDPLGLNAPVVIRLLQKLL